VRSVCEDSAGVFWVVGQTGGLARRENGTWKTLSSADGWPGAPAICVTSNPEGAVWIGTYHGGLYRWQHGRFTHLGLDDGLASDKVHSLLVDRQRNLWIALETPACVQRWHEGQFQTYTQPQDEFPVRAMAEDAAGNIWMAASDGLLLRVSGNALVDETRRTLWPPVTIRCLQATPDGTLWIGYAGAGVGRLRDGHFATIGEEQGLLDAYVSNLASDDYGAFWFASDRGIFKVRHNELDAVAEGRASRVFPVAYGRDQALPNLQANYGFFPGAIRARDGRLCFSLSTGIAIVHPERVQPNAVAPPVLVEAVAVDGHPLDLRDAGRGLSLPAAHRKVELEFTALSFVAPEDTCFRHRLKGWDENWQETQQQRRVSYTRLPAGEYVFEVTACIEAGNWSEPGAALPFRVRPFLWQTWWFKALVLVTLTGLVAAAVRQHERQRHRLALEQLERQAMMERERARVAQDLHDDLGSGLTEIGLMASLAQRQNLPLERVHQHLRQVTDKAHEMVTALDEIVWAINPRHDSVVSLSHYLCEYAQRFLELTPIRCRLEVARDLPTRPLNPDQRHNLFLAFKEALTNVVRHSQAAEARIKISTNANTLSVVVEDDGRGLNDTTTGQGADGLSNMRERLEQIGGRCEFQSTPNQGTRVQFILPLPEAGQP
jgi:signal transduction histidine kinase/streptogramin lyase